jgi:peptidoglycan-associated lipoprotein
MDNTQRLLAAALGLAVLTTACGGKPAPETPEPVSETPAPPPVATAPAPAPVQVERTDPTADARRAALEERIYFALDRSELSPEARAILAAKVDAMRADPGVSLQIDGHADERGSDEYNLALSKRRAAEAKRFLVQQGVDAGRLETVGYGEEQPLDPASTESAWALNRRAGFRVSGGSVSQR